MRYAAFISYNHRDRRAAGWLHRALEGYRFPKRLRGRDTPLGPLGAKLPPIFQDREELAASSDLAASVRAALAEAASLIVVCSPDGARSHWVNEEIRAFVALGQREQARRARRLAFAAVVLGTLLLLMTGLAALTLVSRQEAIAQRDLARRKTITAERTVDFVKSMFAVADPSEAKGATVTAREIVDRGAARAGRELASEPAVRADLQTTLGEVYANLGLLHQGSALVEQGMRATGLDPGSRARQHLALAEVRASQAKDADAVREYGRALMLARDPAFGRADLVPRILAGYGETLGYLNRSAAGERAIREALRLDRARGGAAQVDVARDLEALGLVMTGAERYDEARRAYVAALAIRLRRQVESHPASFNDLTELGGIAYRQGDIAAAKAYYASALPITARVLGRAHPWYAAALNNIARLEIEQRAYAEALPLLRQAVAIQRAQRAADTTELVYPLFNLALALRGTGQPREATIALEQGRVIATKAGHRNLGPILVEQADLACAASQPSRAAPLLARARPPIAKDYAGEPWRMAWLDLVAAQCRKAPVPPAVRAAILARWPATSHFGARAARAR